MQLDRQRCDKLGGGYMGEDVMRRDGGMDRRDTRMQC